MGCKNEGNKNIKTQADLPAFYVLDVDLYFTVTGEES